MLFRLLLIYELIYRITHFKTQTAAKKSLKNFFLTSKMYKNPENDYLKADSTNLPKIDMFMVRNFLVSDSRYNAPEVRGVKLSQ